MIAATSNSALPGFRSTTPFQWSPTVTSPGIPCHLAERLFVGESETAA